MTVDAPPRRTNRAAPRRFPWTKVLPIVTLLLAIAIPLLIIYATRAVLGATDGQLEETLGPADPGYEALLEATPSFLAFGVNESDLLTSVTVFTLAANDTGGTILLVPPETSVPGQEPARIVDIFFSNGPDAARLAVAAVLDANVGSFQVFDDSGWARLTAPVTPLDVNLTDDLISPSDGDGGPGAVVFSAGPVALLSPQTGPFLGWVNPGEDLFNRIGRQRAFWTAWIDAIAASNDPDVVPGEVDVGIGRFLRGLASGLTLYKELPVTSGVSPEGGAVVFTAARTEVAPLVADMMPFPIPVAPGARPRVKLLDGVGGVDLVGMFGRQLVLEGAQIVIEGNAAEFGVPRTVVIYHNEVFAEEAAAFGAALGGAQVAFEPLADVVIDVTIVVGPDLAVG